MADYPEDLKWWRELTSVADFCSKAGFGPITTKLVEENIDSLGGSFNVETITRCAQRSLHNLFMDVQTPSPLAAARNKDLDQFIKVWVVLRRKYDEQYLPIASQVDAASLTKSLFPVKDLNPQRFQKAATAFGRAEKPSVRGDHASQGVLDMLMNQHAQFSSHHLAPYTTIVGPTGIGKTFSVRQMALRYGVYVSYANLASEDASVYPRPVVMGQTPLDNTKLDAEEVWKTYLENQMQLVDCCKIVGITAGGLFELLTSNETDQMRTDLRGHFGVVKVNAESLCKLLVPVKDNLDALGLNPLPVSPLQDTKVPVIICLDEARALLDDGKNRAFETLRIAAREKAIGTSDGKGGRKTKKQKRDTVPFFIVLLDTTSRISNFTPPTQYDYKARTLQLQVFQPIFQIDSFNLFTPLATALEDPTGTDNAVEQLFAHGRPLWGAYLEAGSSWNELLVLAKDRISTQKDRLAYDLSLLTFRMNFYICSPVLAEAMVASSLRFLISVSPSRDSMVTAQPSEPVLALTSACLLQDPSVRHSCIQSWIRGLHSGSVNPGDIGEQVASLVLLFASDYASEPGRVFPKADSSRNYMVPKPVAPQAITLRSFLSALLGDSAWQQVLSCHHNSTTLDILNSGLVFFNHFIRLSNTPTLAALEVTYKRGAALFLHSNFPGMDIAIPVRVPNGRMALLLIQVKNRKDDSFTPGLKLYMNEGLGKAEAELNLKGQLYGIVGLVLCLRTSGDAQFSPIVPVIKGRKTRSQSSGKSAGGPSGASAGLTFSTSSTFSTSPLTSGVAGPLAPHTAKGKGKKKNMNVKEKEKQKEGNVEPFESAQLLGMVFGLNATVYPCLKATNAAALKAFEGDKEYNVERSFMEKVCRLLVRLLEQWPNAYAEEDVQSGYAQKLLDPVSDLGQAEENLGGLIEGMSIEH